MNDEYEMNGMGMMMMDGLCGAGGLEDSRSSSSNCSMQPAGGLFPAVKPIEEYPK
jgi:hypothetical protein